MINNVVFPHSVEVRPSFVIARLKDDGGGATTRIIAQFDLVKNFSLDPYGNPTIANMHDPIFMDLYDNRMVDPASFHIVTKFDPNNIGSAVLKLQEDLADRDAKIVELDKMVKQLAAGNDPRVVNLQRANDFAQDELKEVRQNLLLQERRADDMAEGLRRQSQTLQSSGKEVAELREKVTKLTNDLMATANERDNRVEQLARAKADEMLPNIRRERDYFKKRSTEQARQLVKANEALATIDATHDENSKSVVIAYEREIRALSRKLRKACGRERYWKRQIEILRKENGPLFYKVENLKKQVADLTNKLDTVNGAFKIERDANKVLMESNQKLGAELDGKTAFSKEQVRTVGVLEEALDNAMKTYMEEANVPTEGKTINVTVNICGNVTINELNNYN